MTWSGHHTTMPSGFHCRFGHRSVTDLRVLFEFVTVQQLLAEHRQEGED